MSANNAGEIVRILLTGNAAVAALVAGRIYPNEAPDEADLPLIVYGIRLGEEVDGSAPMVMAAIDVHCYAANDDSVQALAVAVDGVLANASGYLAGTWVLSMYLQDWDEVTDTAAVVCGRLLRYGATVTRV